MKLHFKEEPKEWRKVTLLGLVGPSVVAVLLRWHGVISWKLLAAALALFLLIALLACAWPRWFRGYYRFATWVGFHTIQFVGQVVLMALFFLILAPFGWILRLFGKNLLQLKSQPGQQTFWQPARKDGSLDSMY